MGEIMTKKRCALDDESLGMLKRISHRQEPLKSHELNQILETLNSYRDCRILPEDVHC